NLGLRGVNLGLRGVNLGLCHVNRAPLGPPSGRAEGNAATARQLAVIPSSMNNRASQMKGMPRSKTANTEAETDALSSRQRNTRQILRPPWGNAASCRGVAVFGEGKLKIPRGFVHFGWGGSDNLT